MVLANSTKFDEEGDSADDERRKMQEDGVFIAPVREFTYNWQDVTQEFFNLAKCLSLGELLHDENFGLFEAMSAIEMMDPKMDAGMLCNRGDKPVLTFNRAVELGVLRIDTVPIADQIGIMDHTLACLVSWLEGHSLAQTVFTNLYLHKPFTIEDRTLKAFCIATYKLVDIIKNFINVAAVSEEEDYQPMQYGYRLVPDVSEPRTIGMLREVEEELQRRLRQKLPPSPEEKNQITALQARIKFVRLLYSSLAALSRQEGRPEARGETRPETEVQKNLNACAEQLAIMQRTISLGTQVDEADNSMLGFEPLVNQRLLPPTFPRYTKIKTRTEACAYYEELIQKLKLACKIYSHTSFHSALDFFIEFSNHNPCILSRSVLQLLYMPQPNRLLGFMPIVEVLKEASRTFICPPSLVSRTVLVTNPQAKEYLDAFLIRSGRPFIQLIQLCGHNRARQRDKLAHLLEDFAGLQDDAERVDAYFHNICKTETSRSHLACFGTWVLYHTLRVMVMYLLAGFELELYAVHEYLYIFWYLYEFLYGWLVSSLTRADSFLLEQENINEKERGKGKKTKARRKKGSRPFSREITMYKALQNLSGGFYKAMVGFHKAEKVNLPKAEFDSERVRYDHRFQPFSCLLTPPPMQYSEFRDMLSTLDAQLSAQGPTNTPVLGRIFLAACKNFHQARLFLETISNPDQEVNDLLRVAKTNFVVLKLLAGGHKEESKTPPVFDFSVHRYFPIIKLV